MKIYKTIAGVYLVHDNVHLLGSIRCETNGPNGRPFHAIPRAGILLDEYFATVNDAARALTRGQP